jgi:endonuclease G
VVNDQWQVVAIHHKAIPKPGEDTKKALDEGREPEWIANEGVRISAISKFLERRRFSDRDVVLAVDRLDRAIGIPAASVADSERAPEINPFLEKDPSPHKISKWRTWQREISLGYNADFLPIALPLPEILGELAQDAAHLKGSNDGILDYLHFSTVMHAERKFPIITAVNIRGDMLVHPGERTGKFRRDTRIDDQFQPAGNFYEKKLGDDPVSFSRGHLVRRFDPCWGETKTVSRIAEDHTFHYTNAAPQVQGFNAGDWLTIEDFVLNRVQMKEKRMTVFTGPVFREFDPEYGDSREGGPWQIPVAYWKVVAIEKSPGEVAATAFLRGQTKFVKALFEAQVFTNLRQNTLAQIQSRELQTTIAAVEGESGLNFSRLRPFDSLSALESTRHTRFLFSSRDIVI